MTFLAILYFPTPLRSPIDFAETIVFKLMLLSGLYIPKTIVFTKYGWVGGGGGREGNIVYYGRLENREVKNMNSIYYLMVVISVLLEGLDPARSMYKIENG